MSTQYEGQHEAAMRAFVRESNRIEGILRVRGGEVAAHWSIMKLERLTVPAIVNFVKIVADAELRSHPGQNVVITMGREVLHRPPLGGPEVERQLGILLQAINDRQVGPFEAHLAYEHLHPFTDGNGRSGRVIWLWQMSQLDRGPFSLPFLQRFYYQALQANRRPPT